MQTQVRPAVSRITIRCTVIRKGRLCDHVVATVPLEAWEQSIIDGITFQCGTCGKVYSMLDFR